MTKTKNIALVFSGGGARGAYQVGVWQALIDLGISERIAGAYGTSVGAINGAAFVQQDIQLAKDIWSSLSYQRVFADFNEDTRSVRPRKRYYKWVKGTIRNRGMDVTPLKDLLRRSLNEVSIRSSPLSFGLVTYDLTNRSALYLTKPDIPQGTLVEYIIASATFPTFQPHRIGNRKYIDGGIVDNRPVGFLARDTSVDTIICVDVTMARHFWMNKKSGGRHRMIYVRPSRLLGSPLAFRKDKILRNLLMGYDDAMEQLSDQITW